MRALIVLMLSFAFCMLSLQRDRATGGPHHDEVIALMAAKGLERDFARITTSNEPPLHTTVPARQWQRYTHEFPAQTFSEIRSDVLSWDKHPPLAFWVMNRWLNVFPQGQYRQAVWLMLLQIIIAALLLTITIQRCSGQTSLAFIGFAVFLCGNSTVFTGTWVRQYALFMVFYAMVVLASAELAVRNLPTSRFLTWTAVIAVASWLGMMCQYTFSTMSGPIHLVLLTMLTVRRQWSRCLLLITGYGIAAGLFFFCLPGVIEHASAVSSGLERRWQLADALKGLPRMFVPLPSALPNVLQTALGLMALTVPLVLGACVWRAVPAPNLAIPTADARVPVSGMLGAGLLQFLMVTLGFFPGWATSENHMCAFWLLTVLAGAIVLKTASPRVRLAVVGVAIVGMLFMQGLYTWHTLRILPRVNTSYIASTKHDLICIDNMARGFVLQITDLVDPESPVLATTSDSLAKRLQRSELPDRVLYLPMDESVRNGKVAVLAAAKQAGYAIEELPVVHTGMYEAILMTRTAVGEKINVR